MIADASDASRASTANYSPLTLMPAAARWSNSCRARSAGMSFKAQRKTNHLAAAAAPVHRGEDLAFALELRRNSEFSDATTLRRTEPSGNDLFPARQRHSPRSGVGDRYLRSAPERGPVVAWPNRPQYGEDLAGHGVVEACDIGGRHLLRAGLAQIAQRGGNALQLRPFGRVGGEIVANVALIGGVDYGLGRGMIRQPAPGLGGHGAERIGQR